MTTQSILIVHPVHQHAYEAAVAAQGAGLLARFVTGVYDTRRGIANRRLLRAFPSPLYQRFDRELRRRYHPDLDPRLVESIWRFHLLTLLGRAGITFRGAHDSFDEFVANRLAQFDGVKLLHGFEGMSLATFEAGRARGLTLVLDAASAYEHHVEAQRIEGEQRPHIDPTRIRRERELADWILAPSQYVVDCLVGNGVDPAKIVLIPYGVDCDQFVPRASVRTGPFRVLFLGTVSPAKGLRYLLEAWRALNLADAELLLVGSRTKAGKQLLDEFDGSCRWLPQVPKHAVPDVIAESDIVVLPSLSDSWGLVVGEALASGVPVITTTTTGFPVRHGVDGFVIPPRSAAELARTIGLLRANPALRERMGASGRAYVLNQFTWRRYREHLVEVYRALLAGEKPRLLTTSSSTEFEQSPEFRLEGFQSLSEARVVL